MGLAHARYPVCFADRDRSGCANRDRVVGNALLRVPSLQKWSVRPFSASTEMSRALLSVISPNSGSAHLASGTAESHLFGSLGNTYL